MTKYVPGSKNLSSKYLDYSTIDQVCNILPLSLLPLSKKKSHCVKLCMALGRRENKLLKMQNGLSHGKLTGICEMGLGDILQHRFKNIF